MFHAQFLGFLSQFTENFINTEHVSHTIGADSGTWCVILVPYQSFYGSSMHFPATKSLSTHTIPQYQAAILGWAKTPLSNRIKAQVGQCVPPMDVFSVQYMLHLECRAISNVDCSVVSTCGQYQLSVGHFLPVNWRHSSSVTCQSVNLLPWRAWKM